MFFWGGERKRRKNACGSVCWRSNGEEVVHGVDEGRARRAQCDAWLSLHQVKKGLNFFVVEAGFYRFFAQKIIKNVIWGVILVQFIQMMGGVEAAFFVSKIVV